MGRKCDRKLMICPFDCRTAGLDGIRDNRGKLDRFFLKLDRAVFNAGDFQQIIDQTVHLRDLLFHDVANMFDRRAEIIG